MKSSKLISLFLIYLLLFFDLNYCLKNFNVHKNLENNIDHVIRSINSSHDIFFKNLKNIEKTFSNEKLKRSMKKHVKKMELTYILNPSQFKSDIKDLYLDYNEFLESEDYKSDHDEMADYLHKFSSHFDKLTESEKLKFKVFVNSTYGDYEKNFIFQILDNSYVYNNENFNISSLIEMIPHYFADFSGKHTQPRLDKSYKLNSDFSHFLSNIHNDYNLSSLKNMTSKQRRLYLNDIGSHKTHSKYSEGFSSFLSEYVHESVINNDPLFDRYLSNKEKHNKNDNFDFFKIKEFLKEKLEMEDEKIDRLNIKDLLKNRRKIPPRFQQENSTNDTQSNNSNTTNSTESSNSTNDTNSEQKSNSNSTSNNTSSSKKDNSQKVFNKVKNKLGNILGGKVLQDELKKAKEKENQRIRIEESCNPKETESQVMEIIEKKQKEANEVNEEAKKLMSEVDPEVMQNAGKEDGASNMMKKILQEFIMKMVELLAKHIPFFFFKICVPPGPLTWECCPEAMFFPQQLYHLFTFKEKNEKMKVTAKNYPSFLHVIGRANMGKVFYYICAQGYLSLLESTLWNFCNFPSLNLMNPMTLMGFIPGDLPLCLWACILGMAFCLTTLDNFAPCDGLINLETIIKAIFIIPLRLTLANAMSKCTYIPFLVRWNLVPPYPEENKPAGDNGNDPKEENKPGDGNGNTEPEQTKELNCDKIEQKENPSPFESELKNLDPVNGDKIINDIKENTKMSDEEEKVRIPPPVITRLSNKIKVDLSREKNFDPDEYYQILSNYMENDVYLAKKISENFGKFEIEDNFPFHTKRIVVSMRKENSPYVTSTISGNIDY